MPDQELDGIQRQARVPVDRGPGVTQRMGAYFSVNTGLTRRAPDDTLDPPDAQAGTSVRGQQQAARPTAEIGLKQLPQVGREEDGLSPHRVVIARL